MFSGIIFLNFLKNKLVLFYYGFLLFITFYQLRFYTTSLSSKNMFVKICIFSLHPFFKRFISGNGNNLSNLVLLVNKLI